LTHSHLRQRRHLLNLALFSPFALLGCDSSGGGTNVKVGDATKAENKARAELYKERALEKKQASKKR
jgi:hypothetical protein